MVRRALSLSSLVFLALTGSAQAPQASASPAAVVWRFDQTASIGGYPTHVLGHPNVIATPYGSALAFNGVDDALFIDNHPLAGATTWTWEMIFRPDADGPQAQRVFHLQVQNPATGADTTDRLLFEIRIVKGQWCLDSAAFSGAQHATLLNCDKLYPLDTWTRVTAVYDGTTLRNYVGDELQGETTVDLAPQGPGHTSVGVRINKVYWYKGAMLEARFTRRALGVKEFLQLPPTASAGSKRP